MKRLLLFLIFQSFALAQWSSIILSKETRPGVCSFAMDAPGGVTDQVQCGIAGLCQHFNLCSVPPKQPWILTVRAGVTACVQNVHLSTSANTNGFLTDGSPAYLLAQANAYSTNGLGWPTVTATYTEDAFCQEQADSTGPGGIVVRVTKYAYLNGAEVNYDQFGAGAQGMNCQGEPKYDNFGGPNLNYSIGGYLWAKPWKGPTQ